MDLTVVFSVFIQFDIKNTQRSVCFTHETLFVFAPNSWIFLAWTDELNNISDLLNLSHIQARSEAFL